MQNNPIKDALIQGRAVVGTMIVQVRDLAIVQLLAELGLEYMFIDMEHGSYSIETAADLIQVARLSGITPLVRVGETQYHLYARMLDAGAMGIMTPRVETVEQVRQIIRYTKYPPLGVRGFSRLAAHANYRDIDVASYVQAANQNLINIIQIESKLAVENIDELISVPGVDGVIVGMDDLSLSLGVPGEIRHALAEEALERIVAACQKKGMPWGLHIPDVERLQTWIIRGMQLVTYSSDVWMLQQVLRNDVRILQQTIAETQPQPTKEPK
jgi:2-keto-3-deoxy-L-rhamnonate aldolase RhmA